MGGEKRSELEIQKRIAYTAGVLQGDITVKRLLESIAEGVIIINDLGQIILINSRFEKMTGYTKLEVMGRDISIFMSPNKRLAHKEHLQHFFSNPRVRPMGVGLDLTVYRKDNTKFPVEISISFLESESGPLGIGFITDNTQRKKAIDDLTKRNLELDAYAHTVAHDLKSSLYGISGFSELLLDEKGKVDETESKKYIENIAKSSKKMNEVIRELLLFASIDKVELKLIHFDMKSVIEDACSRLNYQIAESGAVITIDDKILDCTSYPAWVEEVWINYLSNALKYCSDSPKINITSKKGKDGFIKYSVIDNGPGIDPKIVDTLFDENNSSTLKSSKGNGLGLTIVKRIIDKLNGKVSVESEVNKGSNFSFYLKEQ